MPDALSVAHASGATADQHPPAALRRPLQQVPGIAATASTRCSPTRSVQKQEPCASSCMNCSRRSPKTPRRSAACRGLNASMSLVTEASDARWLREQPWRHQNLHDVARVRGSVCRHAGLIPGRDMKHAMALFLLPWRSRFPRAGKGSRDLHDRPGEQDRPCRAGAWLNAGQLADARIPARRPAFARKFHGGKKIHGLPARNH